MNRAQLDALLALGLITPDQHSTSLATRDAAGLIVSRPTFNLDLPSTQQVRLAESDDPEAPDTSARQIIGTVSAYEYLIPSHMMILHTGCLQPRQPLTRVKMLRDHNHSDPVGYMTEFDAATLEATFYVPAGENGDRALDEAGNGLRDGFSVGFSVLEYEFDADWILHVYAADFYETSLCAIPAVADAGVTSVAAALATHRKDNHTMNRATLAAALAAGTITQEQHDAALAAIVATEAALAAPGVAPAPVDPALAAGPQPPTLAPARVDVAARPMSLSQASQRIAAAAATHNPQAVALALTEVLPTDDAGHAFIGRGDWIGEVWQAEKEGRPWIDSFGPVLPLTGTKVEGFKWDETPVPEKYEGGLEEVPSNGFSTTPVSAEPERWAWAARIDRIFRDLGSEDLVSSLFGKLTKNHERVSDFDVASKVLAAATVPAAGQPGAPATRDATVLTSIRRMATGFRTIGASLDQIWMAEDVFDKWSDVKIADLPAWLANQMGFVNIAEGTTTIGELKIEADPKLASGTIAGYDKRAVTVREKSPIQLEALVIANGGIDIGFFSYGGILVNDSRAVAKRFVTVA